MRARTSGYPFLPFSFRVPVKTLHNRYGLGVDRQPSIRGALAVVFS
jgi:hypothetical protein